VEDTEGLHLKGCSPFLLGKNWRWGMPAKSKAQQRFMGAELGRKRVGKKTKTGMSEKQLKEFASTPRKGLPKRKGKRK